MTNEHNLYPQEWLIKPISLDKLLLIDRLMVEFYHHYLDSNTESAPLKVAKQPVGLNSTKR